MESYVTKAAPTKTKRRIINKTASIRRKNNMNDDDRSLPNCFISSSRMNILIFTYFYSSGFRICLFVNIGKQLRFQKNYKSSDCKQCRNYNELKKKKIRICIATISGLLEGLLEESNTTMTNAGIFGWSQEVNSLQSNRL